MSTHTPGPWHVHNHHVDAGKFRYLQTCMEGAPEDEWEANAHLIAAAPELLAACQSICGVFEGHEDVPIYVRKARAAIAKAEGKS